MALYVVQHGKSLPKTEDPDQGLATQGEVETDRIADVAAGYNVRVSRILHSGKKRARQTAERLERRLSPAGGTASVGGMNPMDDVRSFAFSGHLIEVSDILERKTPEAAMAEIMSKVGFGSSDYGSSLADFEDEWMNAITPQTTVIASS